MARWLSNHPPTTNRKRRYNVRSIKATFPYTVQEIAKLLGIHKNAVLRWLKDGLHADRNQRPFLVRGDELVRFLNERQNGKRRRCGSDEFFCFKCRTPRQAYLSMVDILILSEMRLRIRALCSTCDTVINKVQSVRDLPKIRNRFHVQELRGEHLLKCPGPSVNSDSET